MARSEKPAFAANIDAAVAPYLSILRDEGRERECLVLGVEVTRKQDEGAKRAGLARHPLLDTHRSVARLYEELFRRDLLYLHLWTRQC